MGTRKKEARGDTRVSLARARSLLHPLLPSACYAGYSLRENQIKLRGLVLSLNHVISPAYIPLFCSGTRSKYQVRGGSRGRVQGVRTPPSPWDDLRFSYTTGILPKKKTMWFIGVEVEPETSAPPPKKNPGSAPAGYVVPPKLPFKERLWSRWRQSKHLLVISTMRILFIFNYFLIICTRMK